MNANRPPLENDTDLTVTNNVFADIIAGDAPASVVYRDDLVMAFMDIQPLNQGHTLVVPLRPARFLDELNEAEAARIFVVGRRVAQAIRASGLPCTGIFMFLADGATAGQEVCHVHLHVVPRFVGDELSFNLPERYFSAFPAREQLDQDAEKLRVVFEGD